jgi:hypothetical protein
MTQVDDESLAQLGELRNDFLKQVRSTSNDSATRKHLLEDLGLPFFARVAADAEYHPAVRLNAVVLIGNLNRRDGQRNVEPTLPMEAALRELLNIAGAADAPAYLKIGALSGILRHASIDGQLETPVMEAALRENAINLAIAVLDATAPPADTAPLTDEQYWMRRQAVQVLGAFRAPGTDGKAVVALRKVLDDPQSPLWLAADAVEAYGNIRFASPEQADVPNAVKSIAAVVNRFFQADIQAIDDYVDSIKENRMIAKRSTEATEQRQGDTGGDDLGAAGAALRGRGGQADERREAAAATGTEVEVPNYKINDVRQRTKSIVFIARRALDGLPPRRRNEVKPAENLKARADEPTSKIIEQVVTTLDNVMEQTDLPEVKAPSATSQINALERPKPPETNDQRLRNLLKNAISSIESALGGAAPADGQQAIKAAVGG